MTIQHTNSTREALARIATAPATSDQASAASEALVKLVAATKAAAEASLAQLGAAGDLDPQVRQLGLRLQRLLADAERTSLALGLANVVREAGAIAAALDKLSSD
jgi:hypothetical protein